MKLISLLFITLIFILPAPSYSLSEYGRICNDNNDCVKCRDDSKECQACMNKCWNFYGPADTDSAKKPSHDKEELCRIKRAKWCNAQCWDPDDLTNPDYVSSKPRCSDKPFPDYSYSKRPW
jgi:hypothetical protein